ncbi:hypothetical protein SAMN05660199_00103 [Klenkia soli]|uniref:Uncharacterized protein n=1 Tax=Klenkia soli TaxID=1052260 RepID=A0A1H0BSK6_9ACTN|nr:hypothetical protein SAMN05660199_00103 [Klenkia soli]
MVPVADRAAWIGEQELPGFRGGIDVRVSLRTDAGPGLHGAWWPRSTDLAVELPELVAALGRRGVFVTRFTYPFSTWHVVPRKLAVGERIVRVGGFGTGDPQLVSLTCGPEQLHLELLVVPPGTEALFSARALRMAAHPGAALTARAVLTAAGRHPALRTGEIAVQTAG